MSIKDKLDLNKFPEKSWKIFRISTFFIWAIALLIIAVYIVGQFVYTHESVWNDEVYSIDSGWEWVKDDGDTENVTLPAKLPVKNGESVRLVNTVPDNVCDGMYLMFHTGRQFQIIIDGEVRMSLDQDDMELPGRILKAVFWVAPLYDEDASKTIEVYRDGKRIDNGNFSVIQYGYYNGLVGETVRRYSVNTILTFLLLIISLLLTLGCIIYGYRTGNILSIKELGYGTLIVSIWLLCDSNMYQFVFQNYYVDGVVEYMTLMIMPFPFIRYLNMIQERRYEKAYNVLNITMILSFLIFAILNFTNIRSYEENRIIMNSIMIVVFVVALSTFAYDMYNGYSKKYHLVVVGMMGLGLSAIVEIGYANFYPTGSTGTAIILGLYVLFAFCLLYSLNEYRTIEQEKQKAQQASMLKSNFLANMSHEIRTPINSIIGMNEMIMRENKDPNIGEYSDYIARSSKLLLEIISDILDFSKIESGVIGSTNEEYDTAAMLRTMTDLLEERTAQKNLRPVVTVDANIPARLVGDEMHIQQVLVNIISNAVKYTETGTVTFSAHVKMERDGNCRLCFRVSDTGIGMRDEDVVHIFDSFSRFDEKRNKSVQGTGLGMAISKNLIDALGGSIEIESEYNRGSNFMVEFPQKISGEGVIGDRWRHANAEEKVAYEKIAFQAPNARALAVDDNNTNLLIIRQYLKKTGIHVDMCTNGADALKKCGAEKYDIILLDHMMPIMDGIETITHLRAEEGPNKNVPVIALTANALSGCREEYLGYGFTDYIPKPINVDVFEQMIVTYLPKDKIIFEEKEEATKESVEESQDMASTEVEYTIDRKKLIELFGDESFVNEIIRKVAEDSLKTLDKLHSELADNDMKNYAIDAHGIKGMMASIYYEPLRDWAKKHEFAAKDGDIDFIKSDLDAFTKECTSFCNAMLKG